MGTTATRWSVAVSMPSVRPAAVVPAASIDAALGSRSHPSVIRGVPGGRAESIAPGQIADLDATASAVTPGASSPMTAVSATDAENGPQS